MFKGLVVLKLDEQWQLITNLHNEIGHFGKGKTLAKVNKCYFWHNKTELVKDVVHTYKNCQLVKKTKSVRSELEDFKNISIWDQFFKMVLDTTRPLLETKHGNMYVLVAIDHYLKWCEAKVMMNHDAKIITKILEGEVICRFRVPKYILVDNGIKWSVEFDQLCKNYNIVH
jgi:hypothetical protein